MEKEEVILVDEQDNEIGTSEKLNAHVSGVLHRALSVLIYNSKGQLLLQRRALDKYHSGGLWTNTCCSHPKPNEDVESAAKRRLKEEMGITIPQLNFLYKFLYKINLNNNLTEHELDHVLIACCDDEPIINPKEVMAYKYMSIEEIENDMKLKPDNYTYWFKLIFNTIKNKSINLN